MTSVLVRKASRKTLAQIRYVSVVAPDEARDLVATVYADAEREFGVLAAPIALHAPAPELLAGAWMMFRETLVADGLVDRAVKEAVAISVSLGNACAYCADLHLTTLEALNERRDATGLDDLAAARADQRTREISRWALASAATTVAIPWQAPPFPAAHRPELVGTLVATHYLNRMAGIFLPETLVPGVPTRRRGDALRLLGQITLLPAGRFQPPGASLRLLPAAALPDDLAWATGQPAIAGAFGSVVAAVEAAGARSVPDPVRALVLRELSGWNLDATRVTGEWVSRAVSGLAEADRATGRLALLAALAPYLVDRAVIEDFRRARPDDRALVEVASWASLVAARQVGSRAINR
jgi:AhpD family alkylhydroperoxidase